MIKLVLAPIASEDNILSAGEDIKDLVKPANTGVSEMEDDTLISDTTVPKRLDLILENTGVWSGGIVTTNSKPIFPDSYCCLW